VIQLKVIPGKTVVEPYELVGSLAIDGEDNLYTALYRETDGFAFYKFRQQ
jgi:hypothetical protein